MHEHSVGAPRDFLALLSCPYCGFRLSTESADVSDARVCYGVLRCACHEYPVIEGIPILQQVEGLQKVVQLVREADRRGALLRALDLFRVQWAQQSRVHRLKYRWNCSRLVSQPQASFADAAHLVRRPGVFADYLVHRYANPSFLAAVGPLTILARSVAASTGSAASVRPPRVLDLACGAGHASHLMSLLRPELLVVSADQDFVNLYLARRYLAPDGLHLCLDAQVPSPFPDDFFDAVYCQDAFHYFRSKKAAVGELKRVARSDALWVFPHLHNRLCHNLVPGLPLAPADYLDCFDLRGARLFNESDLLHGWVTDGAVDLRGSVPAASLDSAATLTLVRGGDELWHRVENLPLALCDLASALQFNPIYQVRRDAGELLLERRWPNPVMARECAEAEDVLPERCRLDRDQIRILEQGHQGVHPPWLQDLVARFVLVPLPPGYLSVTSLANRTGHPLAVHSGSTGAGVT